MVETWTPEVITDQPPAIPTARATLELAAKQQLAADLEVRELRAANEVTAAADRLSAEFALLRDAIKPWRRPIFVSLPVGESKKAVPLLLPAGGPCVLETINVLPGAPAQPSTAVATGTVSASIRGLLPIDFTVFGWSTTGEVIPYNLFNIPIETDRTFDVDLAAVGSATGLWHVVIVLAREQLRV